MRCAHHFAAGGNPDFVSLSNKYDPESLLETDA